MFLGEVFFLFLGYLSMYGAMQYYYTYIVGDVSGMSLALTLLTLLAIPTMILAAYLNGKGIAKIKLIQFGAIVDCVGFCDSVFYIQWNDRNSIPWTDRTWLWFPFQYVLLHDA